MILKRKVFSKILSLSARTPKSGEDVDAYYQRKTSLLENGHRYPPNLESEHLNHNKLLILPSGEVLGGLNIFFIILRIFFIFSEWAVFK